MNHDGVYIIQPVVAVLSPRVWRYFPRKGVSTLTLCQRADSVTCPCITQTQSLHKTQLHVVLLAYQRLKLRMAQR